MVNYSCYEEVLGHQLEGQPFCASAPSQCEKNTLSSSATFKQAGPPAFALSFATCASSSVLFSLLLSSTRGMHGAMRFHHLCHSTHTTGNLLDV